MKWCPVLIALCAWSAGCARTWVEAELPAKVFEDTSMRVVNNGRGDWLVVYGPKMPEGARHAVVEKDGERKLFHAIARGLHTVELMPVGPMPGAWLQGSDATTFKVTYTRVLDEKLGLTEPLGIVRDGKVLWLGKVPSGERQVVLCAPTITARTHDFTKVIYRAARFKEGVLLEEAGQAFTAKEGAFVVDDGPIAPRPFRVAVTHKSGFTGEMLPADLRGQVRQLRWPAEQDVYGFQLVYFGRRWGADAIILKHREGWVVGLTEPTDVVSGGRFLWSPTLATTPWYLTKSTDVVPLLRGLRALRDGHVLTAFKQLKGLYASVYDNTLSPGWHRHELLGMAGMSSWTRAALLKDRKVAQAPELLYVARAHLLGGALDLAEATARQALDTFPYSRGVTRPHGLAQALEVLARVAAERGEWEDALKYTRKAAEFAVTSNNHILAAQLEQSAALYARLGGKEGAAQTLLKSAHARFYHARDVYASAFAELELAELLFQEKVWDGALRKATFAGKRFSKLSERVGARRAELLLLMTKRERENSFAWPYKHVQNIYEEALKRGDDVTAALAATGQIGVQVHETAASKASYGVSLLHGGPRLTQALVRPRVDASLATLCVQDLVGAVREARPEQDALYERVERACERVLSTVGASPDLLDAWVSRAFMALQLGRKDDAIQMSERMKALSEGEFSSRHPVIAARVHLLGAVVATVKDGLSDDAREEMARRAQTRAFTALRSMDVSRRALSFLPLAQEMVMRGHGALAAKLLREAWVVAASERQVNLQRQISLRLITQHVQEEDWAAASQEVQRVEPLLAARGVEGSQASTELMLYKRFVVQRLGKGTPPRVADVMRRMQGRPASEQIHVWLAAAKLALMGGEKAQAQSALREVRALEKSMPSELATKLPTKRARARRALLEAQVLQDQAAAQKAVTQAIGIVSADPEPEAALLWVDALELQGSRARTNAELERVLIELGSLQKKSASHPNVLLRATRVAAALELSRGRADRAHELLMSLYQAGYAVGASTQQVSCVLGRVLLMHNERQKEGLEHLNACTSRDGSLARQAGVWVALSRKEEKRVVSVRRALDAMLTQDGARMSVRDRERLLMLRDAPDGATLPDPRRRKALQKAYKKSLRAAVPQRLDAATALLDALLQEGDLATAQGILTELGPLYAAADARQQADHARLRLEAAFLKLDILKIPPTQMEQLATREDVPGETRAGLYVALARRALMLEQWQSARAMLASALQAAPNGSRWQTRARALATRFQIPLKTK